MLPASLEFLSIKEIKGLDVPVQNNGFTNWQALEGFSIDKSSGSGQYLLKSFLSTTFGEKDPRAMVNAWLRKRDGLRRGSSLGRIIRRRREAE